MPPKTIPTTATTLGSVGNTSIGNTDLQLVIMGRLQEIVDQRTGNEQVLKNKIAKIGILKVKILLVKKFMKEKIKLKGFLIQIKLKIRYKEVKLPIIAD